MFFYLTLTNLSEQSFLIFEPNVNIYPIWISIRIKSLLVWVII